MCETRFVGLEPRSRASPEQFAALLEFMESHGDLTKPQHGPQGRLKADRLWQELVDLLNAIGGGVVKSIDKWKKEPLSIRINIPTQSSPTELTSQNLVGNEISQHYPFITEGHWNPPAIPPIPPPMSFQNTPSRPQISTPPNLLSTSTPTRTAPRGRRRTTSPLPMASPIASTPRRRRVRRLQTPFERSTYKFVEIENRRLELEELRENNTHQREMERLRLDSRRLDMEESNVQANNRLYGVLTEILTTLKPLSRP